jgi:plastocyanin
MYAHFNEPPPPVTKFRPDCPPEIVATLERMLAKEPADRFPDVEAAVAALGGTPLAHDDPIRTRMMTLAATGAAAQTLRGVATPVSPSPPARSKVGRTVQPTTGMTLSPARVTVAVGGAVQLTAARKSRGGATLPGDAITWASTNSEVATVSDSGLVTAVGPGTVIITATMGAVSATGQVTVTPAQARRSRAAAVVGGLLALGAVGVGAWLLGPWNQGPAPVASRPPAAADTQARVQAPPPAAPDTAGATPVAPPPVTNPAPRQVTPPRREDPAVRERARNDSLLAGLRAEAQTARGRALGAGATAADLAAGDAARDTGERLARAGRFPEAFTRFGEAQAQWRLAEQAARDRAAQAAAAAAAPPPRVDPAPVQPVAPAAPSPAAIRQQIIDAVLAYGRALESRNISQIRLAYPGLTSAQEQGWRGFFQEAQNVRVSLGVTEVQQSGDAAEVTVNGTLEYTQSRRAKRDPMPFRATLERGAGGWRITVIR